ncbi:hypothetical protein HMPREF9536_00505 [Escherichia coli MS 84-1]|nr:hypothetical protein HMPREF9536_00505 [Escherichia coli MS 84-1]
MLGHYILLSGVVTATRSQLKCDDNVSPKYKELIVKICRLAQGRNVVLQMNKGLLTSKEINKLLYL